MAQTGFTPLLIYSSSTATNAPSVGNLLNNATGSELAINIADGKLFYKDSSNAVQVIAWKTTPTTAGGTGLTSYTAGDMVYWASGTAFTKLGIGSANYIMTSSGTAPQWSASIGAAQGGTGITSYAVGDLIYASATTTLSKLADVATGNALISGGVATAPSWGKIGLTTHVSGTLAVGNGGTGLTTLTANYIPYGNGTSAFSSSSGFTFDGTNLLITATSTWTPPNSVTARIFSVYGLAVGNSTTSAAYVNDRITFNASTFYVLGSSTGGGVKLDNGTTAWAAQSDETTKDIIEPISSAIDKVKSLRAVIGKYKEDTEGTRRSFLIAQDVQQVLPEAVSRSGDGFLSLRYTEVIPLLVAAIKEQQVIIDNLKSKVGL